MAGKQSTETEREHHTDEEQVDLSHQSGDLRPTEIRCEGEAEYVVDDEWTDHLIFCADRIAAELIAAEREENHGHGDCIEIFEDEEFEPAAYIQ